MTSKTQKPPPKKRFGHWEWTTPEGDVYGVLLYEQDLEWYSGKLGSRIVIRSETLQEHLDAKKHPAYVPPEILSEIRAGVQGLFGPHKQRKAHLDLHHNFEQHVIYSCWVTGGKNEVMRRWKWRHVSEKPFDELTADDGQFTCVSHDPNGKASEKKVSYDDFIAGQRKGIYWPEFLVKEALSFLFERGYADKKQETEIRGRHYDVWAERLSDGLGEILKSWTYGQGSWLEARENALLWCEESVSFLGSEHSAYKTQSFESFLKYGPCFGPNYLDENLRHEVREFILTIKPKLQV